MHFFHLIYLFLHLLPVQDQELATAEPVGRGTPKTVSAGHRHTEAHILQETPSLKE